MSFVKAITDAILKIIYGNIVLKNFLNTCFINYSIPDLK